MTAHVSRFVDVLHSYHITLTPPQVQSALQAMNLISGPLSVQQGKQEARSLQNFLKPLRQPLKYLKALEAVAQLHGFRTWHAVLKAELGAAIITPHDPTQPTLKVRMGAQGLSAAAGQAASRHLHDVLFHLLGAYARRHWQLDVTVDRTAIEEVRAAIGHLLGDAPDEEVSDSVSFVLPSGFSEDGLDALQQDAMEVILVVREYAWVHAAATAPTTARQRPNRFEYDIAETTQDLETRIPAAVLNPVPRR